MAFEENPLSLSLSQTALEELLRENGHLETLDRTGLDHHLRLHSRSSFRELPKSAKSNAFMKLTGISVYVLFIFPTLKCLVLDFPDV